MAATKDTMITKPMLAAEVGFFGPKFPVLATPKVDGFRFLKVGGRALTRSMTPIRNRYVREWIESNLPDGMDGEITVGGSFNEAQRALGREDAIPDFRLWIFDHVYEDHFSDPYADRIGRLVDLKFDAKVTILFPVEIKNDDELDRFEADCLARRFEGVMLRDPNGPYKCGRSTEAEGYLLKLKRFVDAEGTIVGAFESTNPGQLGGFVLLDGDFMSHFRVKAANFGDLREAWTNAQSYIGRRVKYRYQPHGTQDAPRFPVMIGIREDWDLD